MSTSVASGNGLVVVTHVYREEDASKGDAPPNVVVPPVSPWLGNGAPQAVQPRNGAITQFINVLEPFVRRDQRTLGTVQVLIGVIVFLFGIVTTIDAITVSAKSGIMFWGSVIHVIAGYLTVVNAKDNSSQSLDKVLLTMNIFSCLTAAVAIVLYCLDFKIHDYCYYNCYYNMETIHGISGVMLVLSLLEFMLSAAVSVITYNAISSSTPEVSVVKQTSSQQAQYLPPSYETVTDTVNTSETRFFPSAVPPSHHGSSDKPEDLPSTA
ncbi:membrane-spanning 4-domains subfamily A member 4A-like [Alosa pseudoharengus]|uniref:membrane-spanning 4-domains subfamily A member 4A-like n=1 Tax=Alosa pseudoharengus TaxID=34774 RepID=UPI003F89A0BD